MMAGKRILFFGVTGVDKKSALKRLADWVGRHLARDIPKVVDFEADYLFNESRGGRTWYGFLDDTIRGQRRQWNGSWGAFVKDLPGVQGESDLFLSMHASIVRGYYGVRSVIDPLKIARDFKPDLVVTLLDDVYDMWWRTEQRAEGEQWAGTPTLEQLLFARRTELIMADQVALSSAAPIRDFVIAVSHPCQTLANRIYSPNPTVVYLCFPISAPRELEKDGDRSGVEEVNKFLRDAFEQQRRNPSLVFVCPLAIDELPLLAALGDENCRHSEEDPKTGKNVELVTFDRTRRWSLDDVWRGDACLTSGPPAVESRRPIPARQISDASGMIVTDVGWRDYRLVAQAEDGCLAAFNPKFKNRKIVSRSVAQEIAFASTRCPVFIFQNAEHDPDGVLDGHYPHGGTMQPSPGAQMVSRKNSVEDVFDAIEELARRRGQ